MIIARSDLNNNLTAADGEQFRYGKTADGQRGIIVTGEDGADTVIPFRNGAEYVTSILNTGYSSGSFEFPDDYRECYLVISIFRLGTGTSISNVALSNGSATYEELYNNVRENSKNTAENVAQRTLVYKFIGVKAGDVFSYNYTARSEAHVSLLA